MTPGAPDVESPHDVPTAVPELRRERVVVRRRRAHSRHRRGGHWAARTSRRKMLRAFAVCAGVLMVMAVGLYFGLARQEIPPPESSRSAPAIASPTTRTG